MSGRIAALLAAVLIAAAACGVSTSPGTSAVQTIPGPGGLSGSDEPVSPVVGTVSSVDPPAPPAPPSPKASPSASAGKATAKPTKSAVPTPEPTLPPVKGFTLLTTGGETLTFIIGDLDNAADFPPQSLYDRLTSDDPIRVYFTVDGPDLVVHHIEDAG